MQRMTFDTPDTVRKALNLGPTADHFILADSPGELAALFDKCVFDKRVFDKCDQWLGGINRATSIRFAKEGDPSGVAASDALMSTFEKFAFETARRGWTDGVTGALPNVPAFIAGHPLNMRRRVRQDSAYAPISIIVDLSTSAALSADHIARRGAAILALVRILSTRRPIELWAGTGLSADMGKNASWIFARLQTTPLDLATAAHVLTSASFPRRICYGTARGLLGFTGKWPYGLVDAIHRPHMAAILAPAFPHVTETLCLPSLFASDDSVNNPEKWIEQKLAELSPVDLAA